MDRRAPAQSLGREILHQVLAENLGEAADVEDVFFGIERRDLSAHVVQRVDQPAGGPAHAGVEGGEQSSGPGADDGEVLDVSIVAHEA